MVLDTNSSGIFTIDVGDKELKVFCDMETSKYFEISLSFL